MGFQYDNGLIFPLEFGNVKYSEKNDRVIPKKDEKTKMTKFLMNGQWYKIWCQLGLRAYFDFVFGEILGLIDIKTLQIP